MYNIDICRVIYLIIMVKHECIRCNKIFKTPTDLNRHLNIKTPCNIAKPVKNEDNKYICNICNIEFPRKYNLTRHMKSCLPNKGINIITDETIVQLIKKQSTELEKITKICSQQTIVNNNIVNIMVNMNNIENTIVHRSYDSPDLQYITEETKEGKLNKIQEILIKNEGEPYTTIKETVQEIYTNKEHPCNYSIIYDPKLTILYVRSHNGSIIKINKTEQLDIFKNNIYTTVQSKIMEHSASTNAVKIGLRIDQNYENYLRNIGGYIASDELKKDMLHSIINHTYDRAAFTGNEIMNAQEMIIPNRT